MKQTVHFFSFIFCKILWEGVESLTTEELREACQQRGMRAHGLSRVSYGRQLQEWLDLSIQKNIPIALMIMSRAFNLSSAAEQGTQTDSVLRSVSSLDSDTINEVVLAVASPSEEKTIDMRIRKLESLSFQREVGVHSSARFLALSHLSTDDC